MTNSEGNKPGENPEALAAESAESASPGEQIAALAAAADELRDKFLRAVAETDNVRKRAEREVAEARAYGIANLARDVINVADNLDRALGAIDPTARKAAEGTLKTLLEGVELTRRELQKALAKHGARAINPMGEKFDPHFHQALFEMPDANLTAGRVAQVVQTGYAIGDRILRPALVGVARGGARPSNDDPDTAVS
ncbi:MAG TPA: nucleotide exchange factor GrpE [Candidatus Limnocylindria bacterium]|nr:nucleotide exchange factor GrpE [Candidatus Limnocylindria bacterium]